MRERNLHSYVRDLRQRKGATQAEFAELLGCASAQYVSKVETGRVNRPTMEFLGALATVGDLSLADLEQLIQRESLVTEEVEARNYKLVFGHCLWGAPIFLAAHRGMLPEFQVASYAAIPGGELEWVIPEDSIVSAPSPSGVRAETWSAVRILDALEREEIDVGAVPGNILWGRQRFQRFSKIGTVVDSATGCTFVTDHTFAQSGPLVVSTHELHSYIAAAREKHGDRVRIAAEPGTVAEDYLQHAFSESQVPAGHLPKDLHNMLFVCENSELLTTTYSELKSRCRKEHDSALIGAITWEPHATWLVDENEGKDKPRKYPLYFSPDSAGKLAHMSFDLVTLRTRNFDVQDKNAFQKLIQKIWQNAILLTELDGSSFDTDPLQRIARYFGYCSKDQRVSDGMESARLAIAGIRYSVHQATDSPIFMKSGV